MRNLQFKSLSQLSEATELHDNDLFEIAQENDGKYTSKKAKISTLTKFIETKFERTYCTHLYPMMPVDLKCKMKINERIAYNDCAGKNVEDSGGFQPIKPGDTLYPASITWRGNIDLYQYL